MKPRVDAALSDVLVVPQGPIFAIFPVNREFETETGSQ
jgi:hypothetical protein